MVVNDSIGLILLAAGGSTRLGGTKQLLEYQGQPLLRHSAETAIVSRCRPVVVVLGAETVRCRSALQGLPVSIVDNPEWSTGMASSIRAGILELEKLPVRISATILCVCDQPLLTPDILNALCEKHRMTGAKIAAAEYAGRLGVPALFDASWFGQLKALSGDEGARLLLRQNPAAVARVPFPGGEWDVDTPDDCTRLPGHG